MNQKAAKELREKLAVLIEGMDFSEVGLEVAGRTTEGILLEDEKGNYVVLRTIVKAETFDGADAMAEYEEKLEKAKEKEDKKKEKLAKLEKEKEKAKEKEDKEKADRDAEGEPEDESGDE